MASIGELKEQLADFNNRAQQLGESIQGAIQGIEKPGEELAQVLEGADSGIDDQVAGALDDAKKALDDAYGVIEQIIQNVQSYADSL